MGRSEENQNLHDKMLSTWSRDLEKNGYKVTAADVADRSRPRDVRGSVPDVEGLNPSGVRFLGEVETSDTIENDHTRGQLRDFVGSGNSVLLLVPKESDDIATSKLTEWGLRERISIWTYSQH